MKIQTPILISIDALHPNEWNPNKQSPKIFDQLVEEIKEDGFEQPLNVVPHSELESHFIIIGGEHRWKAAKVLGYENVPCYVHEDWDEKLQKLKTVRRNLMVGQLDDVKFTALVRELEGKLEISREDLPELLGFETEVEFAKHVVEERAKSGALAVDSVTAEVRKETRAVDALADVLSLIFAESGETVDQNFLHFTYKGSLQTVVLCDAACLKAVKDMVQSLKDDGGTATRFLESAIRKQLES